MNPNVKSMSRDFTRLQEQAGDAARFLKSMAHPARLQVLCRLLEGPATVTELAGLTGFSLSALSQHLAKLRGLELVSTERDGVIIRYSLNPGPSKDILRVLYEHFCA